MSDLTKKEQDCVRAALRFLRVRLGSWAAVAKAVRFKKKTIANVVYGEAASALLAFRVARLAGVPLEDVLAGTYPAPGTCPMCGHRAIQ